MTQRFNGTVIWYDAGTGHGIIRLHSASRTVSIRSDQVHHDSIANIRSLHVGLDVSFEINRTEARNLYFV